MKKLTNLRTGEIEEFPVYKDDFIGLGESWVSDCQIEARMDDDVDTDEEIFNNASDACYGDYKEALNELKRCKFNWESIVANCYISRRVERPDLFDRNGTLI